MPWKLRNGRPYYYRSRRENGRVVTDYFGAGAAGLVAANWMDRRRLVRAEYDQELANLRELTAIVDDAERWCELLVSAGLVVAGYYRCCRGPWRIDRARVNDLALANTRRIQQPGQVG